MDRMGKRITTSLRASVCVLAVLLLNGLVVSRGVCAEPSIEVFPPGNGDLAATQTLIELTRTGPLLIKYLDAILEIPPGGVSAYDNEMLAEECKRRWVFEGTWSMVLKTWTSVEMVPNARIQSLGWVAECNKRMLFDQPEVRTRQRDRILLKVNEELEKATDPEKVRGLLDAAYRTIFYKALLQPENVSDAAEATIDLFKKYVPDTDPIVHDFACARLREMGYLQSSRREELLKFLVENAPELRAGLLMERRPGVNYDTFLGSDVHGSYTESEYLAVYRLSPYELANLVDSTLKNYYSVNTLGYLALSKLVQNACKSNGDVARAQLTRLLRKPIHVSDVLPLVTLECAEVESNADRQAAQKCLASVVEAIEEIPEEEWQAAVHSRKEDLIEVVSKDLDILNKENSDSPAHLYVKEKLAETATRLEAQAEK